MPIYSVYLHFPFCVHRCSYCDFNTYAGLNSLIPEYVQALRKEVLFLSQTAAIRLPIHTIFFGGGTPSLLSVMEIEGILKILSEVFQFQSGIEITLEANPGTISLQYLRDLRSLGANRLSLGMQSAHPDDLQLLERQHGLKDVEQAVIWSRAAGIDNLNLDLIFGIPHQSLVRWDRTLTYTLSLCPDHLSLYSLTLEHGTPLAHWVERGLVPTPDSDLAADMYELAEVKLNEAGFEQYEISNWAKRKPGGNIAACHHNLQYWRSLPYLGFGAGAHGFAMGVRTVNALAPAAYIRRAEGPFIVEDYPFPRTPTMTDVISIDRMTEMGETMMMGLRLVVEGISKSIFAHRFGQSLMEAYGSQIQRLISQELLEWAGGGDILRLTQRGKLLGNRVFREFI